MRRFVLLPLIPLSAFAQTVPLSPVQVEATRSETPVWATPFSVSLFSDTALRLRPAQPVDDILRTVPGFSLFRRGSSLGLNPTAQGVSLRGLGPSGASRSLVLLDGIPLNDAFGGWITWGKVSPLSLSSAEVVPAGGASAWGNAALSGVIALNSRLPSTNEAYGQATAGAFGTYAGEAGGTVVSGNQSFTAEARAYHTDGYTPNAPESRGTVDRDGEIDQLRVSGAWRMLLAPNLRATVRGRYFEDDRNNGTSLQENRADERLGSFRIESVDTGDLSWNANAYVQSTGYESTFSSINAQRTVETPASEQFDVPATAWGANATGRWQATSDDVLTIGADWRQVKGETRENYSYVGNAFTRQRFAGGEQTFAGIFVQHERDWNAQWRTTLGLRGDHWRQSDGHRRETLIATGEATRDDRWGSSTGEEFSPSVGVVWRPIDAWRFHASAQRTFRRPTLNELFRPFRVGPDQTDANPLLRTEHARGGEIGATFTSGRLRVASALFQQDLTDAVANVTLVRGPGTYPDFGFIPAGGSGRRRLNVDRLTVRGLDSSAALTLPHGFEVRAAWLWSDTEVREAAVARGIEGNRIAQTPEHAVTSTLQWTGPRGLTAYVDLRWTSDQYEDDENTVTLNDALTADAGISIPLARGWTAFGTLQNLGDTRVETARTAAGVATLAPPRAFYAGLRWSM